MERRSGCDAFTVLVVCTANHCRSPLIEHLLAATSRMAGASWTVRSAGTRVETSAPAHSMIAAELADRGIAINPEWGSRRLHADLVREADLIITAEDSHRAAVAALDLAARQRTFPLLQLAAVRSSIAPADRVQVTDPAGLVQQVQAHRHLMPPMATIDLADPIGRPPRYFRRCTRIVEDAVELVTGARLDVVRPVAARRKGRR